MLILTILKGPDQGKRFELPDDEPQLIGRSSEALPLIDSIYDGQVDAAVVESDYRKLFAVADDSDLANIAYFESEIAFHYSEERKVQDRYNAIVFGDKNDAAYELLAEALLAQDLSPRLREAIGK